MCHIIVGHIIQSVQSASCISLLVAQFPAFAVAMSQFNWRAVCFATIAEQIGLTDVMNTIPIAVVATAEFQEKEHIT
jgi:ABC-type glycerol-3-phosphate transport system permease component